MSKVALLAPVPLEHLLSAQDVCTTEGRVAFGSRAWDVFNKLDEERKGESVDVYIYASPSDKLEVSWIGRYIGYKNATTKGGHPQGMKFRPESTSKYPKDNEGYWYVFWELDQLRELQAHERISTGSFIGYKTGKQYKKNFAPEGPLIVCCGE